MKVKTLLIDLGNHAVQRIPPFHFDGTVCVLADAMPLFH